MKVREFREGYPCTGCGKMVDEGHEEWVASAHVDDPDEDPVPATVYSRCDCGQLHRIRATRVVVEGVKG